MTTREYFQAVLDAHISADMDEASRILISKLNARNAKRKTTETKEQKAAKERTQAVLDFLCDHQGEPFTRDQIAEALSITPGQVTAACKPIVADGTVVKSEAKIDKARKVVYTYPVEA